MQSFKTWDVDTVTKLKFNPSETSLLASVCNDRSLIFYDLRGKSALQKVYLKNKSSALCWNPQEPMNIVIVSTLILGNYAFSNLFLSILNRVTRTRIATLLICVS